MIGIKNLQFSDQKQIVYRYPDFYCTADNPLCISGNPGTGKTTLLYLLSGILRPNAGGVFIGAINMKKLSYWALDRFRGQNFGIIHQHAYLINGL